MNEARTTTVSSLEMPMYGKVLDLVKRRIVQIGFGGIGSASVQLFVKHFTFERGNIIVLEMKNELCKEGRSMYPNVEFVNVKVDKNNYRRLFEQYLRPGDLLLDLAWYIDSLAEMQWCHEHNVMYVNTAVEWWEVHQTQSNVDPRELTLYARQMEIQSIASGWKYDTNNPTAILTHGANPGWVSHVTKLGLRDWAHFILTNAQHFAMSPQRAQRLTKLLQQRDYPRLAHLLNVQVIHIAEKDTLRSNKPKEINEFICTWSPQGFIEEGMAPAELGWGTHETLKKGVYKYTTGPKHQVCFATRGMNTQVQSFVPSGNMVGMVIRHEEAYSIPAYLTVKEKDGKVLYRPTVHYCYQPCNDAVASMYELTSSGYKPPKAERIPKRDLIDGTDELGVFMLSKTYGAWWIGSTQSVSQSKSLLPHQGPTVTLVAAGVLGAVLYAFRHPQLGVIHPEAMMEDEIMNYVGPYLRPFRSMYVEGWQPHVQATFQPSSSSTSKKTNQNWTIQRLLASPIASIPTDD